MQACNRIENLLEPDRFALEIASVDIDWFAVVTLELEWMNWHKVRSAQSPLRRM